MIAWIRAFAGTNGILVAAISGLLVAFGVGLIQHGKLTERAKTEASNAKAITQAQGARLRRRDPAVGGVLDPHTVAD